MVGVSTWDLLVFSDGMGGTSSEHTSLIAARKLQSSSLVLTAWAKVDSGSVFLELGLLTSLILAAVWKDRTPHEFPCGVANVMSFAASHGRQGCGLGLDVLETYQRLVSVSSLEKMSTSRSREVSVSVSSRSQAFTSRAHKDVVGPVKDCYLVALLFWMLGCCPEQPS